MIQTKNNPNCTEMNTMKEISTHIAVKENGRINIYSKGLTLDDLVIKPELLWSIDSDNQDDLFAIFERLEENNRCNAAEFELAMQS